jgi:hypothetical protein
MAAALADIREPVEDGNAQRAPHGVTFGRSERHASSESDVRRALVGRVRISAENPKVEFDRTDRKPME